MRAGKFSSVEARAAAERQIRDLPARTDFQLIGIWENLVREVAGRTDAETPRALLEMRAALESEWRARAGNRAEGDWFRWPNANVVYSDGSLGPTGWPHEGVLAAVGYHVGIEYGRSEAERRWLLDHVFARTLPPIHSAAYLASWGLPASTDRLRKLAQAISTFARNAKHKQMSTLHLACEQWEADLAYLRERYYVGHFRFGWPQVH